MLRILHEKDMIIINLNNRIYARKVEAVRTSRTLKNRVSKNLKPQ